MTEEKSEVGEVDEAAAAREEAATILEEMATALRSSSSIPSALVCMVMSSDGIAQNFRGDHFVLVGMLEVGKLMLGQQLLQNSKIQEDPT